MTALQDDQSSAFLLISQPANHIQRPT